MKRQISALGSWMVWVMRAAAFATRGIAAGSALALAGCMGIGGGGGADTVAATSLESAGMPSATATAQAAGGEIDVRRYLGSDYCPEIRIREGTEVLRRYEGGHEEEPAYVIWQASIGKTARECLYDLEGNLTLRVGVSGRVVAGPKGGGSSVSLPLRIAVVKFKEKVLASELYPLAVSVPPNGPAVFTEVHEVTVPSPGDDRDYILYIGLDEKGEGLLDATQKPVVQVKKKPPPPPPKKRAPPKKVAAPPAQKPAPQQPKPASEPNMLPVPEGFVLGR
jgi:hypothetical protein